MRPDTNQRETAKMVLRDLLRSETLYQRDQIALTIALAALEQPTDAEIDAIAARSKWRGCVRIREVVRHFLGPVKP